MQNILIWALMIIPPVIYLYGVSHAIEFHSTFLAVSSFVIPPLGFLVGLEGLFFH